MVTESTGSLGKPTCMLHADTVLSASLVASKFVFPILLTGKLHLPLFSTLQPEMVRTQSFVQEAAPKEVEGRESHQCQKRSSFSGWAEG
jgi:hypothetical protein